MKYLIISKKIWSKKLNPIIGKDYRIEKKLNLKKIKKLKPKIIFFIFWSDYIPQEIYKNFLCIQFHTSDLPKFRGGSPIQNQIIRGITKSKISAFRVNSVIDGGDICLKRHINLTGNTKNIFIQIESKIFRMIKNLTLRKKITFYKQKGRISFYKRRTPKESELNKNKIRNLVDFYNLIRSTDVDQYPRAYLKFKNFNIEIFSAKLSNKSLNAQIKISKKK